MKAISTIISTIAVTICISPVISAKEDPLAFSIVPRPQIVKLHKKSPIPTMNSFKVKGADINVDASLDERSRAAIGSFASRLAVVCGKTSSIASPIGIAAAAKIGKIKGMAFFIDRSMDHEQYRIEINDASACISAGGYNGILYALQTLRQMLPVEIYGKTNAENISWVLPCVTIEDKPRFAYRGLHMDCSRHFFSIEEIKRILDLMATFKLNRFHWHLTDDQGWRIESRKYPELTQIGAFRNGTQIGYDSDSSDGIRYGGYYTREQIREIVAYAYRLGIEIVPEIDLPGHMQAVLATYPHLGCKGGPYEVWQSWGISKDVLCAGKKDSYALLKDILEEVCELFPYKYIHIGGDECAKDNWKECADCQAMIDRLGLADDAKSSAEQKLQAYVTSEVQAFLAEKGKTIIGWDEIREGSMTSDAVIMSWWGLDAAKAAIREGYKVILTPMSHCYFNFFQSQEKELEPYAGDGLVTLQTVYDFNPFEEGEYEMEGKVLGIQANLWSEYLDSNRMLEYMLLPRLCAMSEIQWHNGEGKNYELFKNNLVGHELRVFELLGYEFSKSFMGVHNFKQ